MSKVKQVIISLKMFKTFIIFLIKVWKSTHRHERAINKYLKSVKKRQRQLEKGGTLP